MVPVFLRGSTADTCSCQSLEAVGFCTRVLRDGGHRCAGIRAVPFGRRQAQDARHHGRYEQEGHFCFGCVAALVDDCGSGMTLAGFAGMLLFALGSSIVGRAAGRSASRSVWTNQKGSYVVDSGRMQSEEGFLRFLCPWLACVAFHAQEYKWYFLCVVTVLITVEAPQLQCFNKVVDVTIVVIEKGVTLL